MIQVNADNVRDALSQLGRGGISVPSWLVINPVTHARGGEGKPYDAGEGAPCFFNGPAEHKFHVAFHGNQGSFDRVVDLKEILAILKGEVSRRESADRRRLYEVNKKRVAEARRLLKEAARLMKSGKALLKSAKRG